MCKNVPRPLANGNVANKLFLLRIIVSRNESSCKTGRVYYKATQVSL